MSNPAPNSPAKPRFGIGSITQHPAFGAGKVVAYDAGDYVILYKGGEVRRVSFSFENLKLSTPVGDPELDRVRQAVREALEDHGFAECEMELNKRWVGGTLKMVPGKDDTQPKDVPIETFVKKIIGIRDKLRVLEQKINSHATLSPEEKLELEGYITRCYGSLTTFNVFFTAKESQFKGTGKEE